MQRESQDAREDSGGVHDFKDTLGSVAEAVKEETREAADHAKSRSADKIDGLTRAIHGAADELGQQVPQVASYVHAAADRVEGASQALRDRSIEEMAADFAAFTRRQPGAAFALSALAGFALTRFLKSSASSN
jgi:hypothetical protein